MICNMLYSEEDIVLLRRDGGVEMVRVWGGFFHRFFDVFGHRAVSFLGSRVGGGRPRDARTVTRVGVWIIANVLPNGASVAPGARVRTAQRRERAEPETPRVVFLWLPLDLLVGVFYTPANVIRVVP